MEDRMKFARIVFGLAAVYGILSLLPLYFLLDKVGRDAPPPVTHPEFYYGFLGVTFLWQLLFVLMAKDPLRYRPLMPIAILEKLVYVVPVVILYAAGRVHANILRSCPRGSDLRDPLHCCVLSNACCGQQLGGLQPDSPRTPLLSRQF